MKPPVVARRRRGFSMPELMIVLVLASLLIVALQVSLVRQRRLYELQEAVSHRNETLRIAVAVFGSSMREAVLTDGDIEILAPNRVRARVPQGFGVVCGADNQGRRVGVVAPQGRWAAGDSVWLQRAGSWTVDAIGGIDPPAPQVPCTLLSGGLVVRPDVRAPNADASTPIRAYRSQLFESAPQGGSVWLFRVDGAQRELLFGPLDPVDGFRVRYEDVAGAEVFDPALADHVAVRVISMSPDVRGETLARRDTLTLDLGRRNR